MGNETDRRLENIEKKLDGLVSVMEKVAVQKSRLDNTEKRLDGIWKKWDDNISPVIQQCPRAQVRWLWFIVVPQGLTLIALAIAILNKI